MRARQWKPIIDRLCKRLGYRMRCQQSPKCQKLKIQVWREPTRTYTVNRGEGDGVKVVPKVAHGFYLVRSGRNYRIVLSHRNNPTLDATPYPIDHVFLQLIRAIDLLAVV